MSGDDKQLTSQPAKVLVAYYSATGHVHALAKTVAQGAREAGAEVRLRHVEELAPELLISQNQAWGRHRSEVGGSRRRHWLTLNGQTGSRSARPPDSETSQRS